MAITQGRIYCTLRSDGGLHGCQAPPFSPAALAAQLSPEAFEVAQAVVDRYREAGVVLRVRAEYSKALADRAAAEERRRKEQRDRESAMAAVVEQARRWGGGEGRRGRGKERTGVWSPLSSPLPSAPPRRPPRQHRQLVVDTILTLKCPGCGQAFIDFTGCLCVCVFVVYSAAHASVGAPGQACGRASWSRHSPTPLPPPPPPPPHTHPPTHRSALTCGRCRDALCVCGLRVRCSPTNQRLTCAPPTPRTPPPPPHPPSPLPPAAPGA